MTLRNVCHWSFFDAFLVGLFSFRLLRIKITSWFLPLKLQSFLVLKKKGKKKTRWKLANEKRLSSDCRFGCLPGTDSALTVMTMHTKSAFYFFVCFFSAHQNDSFFLVSFLPFLALRSDHLWPKILLDRILAVWILITLKFSSGFMTWWRGT